MAAIAFHSKLEEGAVYLRSNAFALSKEMAKNLQKLWAWMKTTEQTPFLANVSERLMNRIMPACAIAAVSW